MSLPTPPGVPSHDTTLDQLATARLSLIRAHTALLRADETALADQVNALVDATRERSEAVRSLAISASLQRTSDFYAQHPRGLRAEP